MSSEFKSPNYSISNDSCAVGNLDDDFYEWLNSDIGEESLIALDVIDTCLQDAEVDAVNQKIIWSDNVSLNIDETANRLSLTCGGRLSILKESVRCWLEGGYVPSNTNEQFMEKFERDIQIWLWPSNK